MLRDKRLESYITKRQKIYYLVVLFFSLAGAGCFAVYAYTLSSVLEDILFVRLVSDGLYSAIKIILLFALGRFFFNLTADYFSSKAAVEIQKSIMKKLITKLRKIKVLSLKREDPALLPGILGEGLDRLYPFFSEYIPQLFIAISLPILFLFIAFPADWISALILLITAPLIPVFIILINSVVRNKTQKQWDALQRLSSYFSDTLQGMLLIKLYTVEEIKRQKISDMNKELSFRSMDILRIAFVSAFVLEFLATMGTAIIAVEVGIRLLHGALEFRTALFLLILAPEFYIPLRQSGGKFHAAKEASAAADEMIKFLKREAQDVDEQKMILSVPPDFLECENLELNFNGKSLFKNFNLILKKGEIVLLQGPSGSGKSSLAMAIMKYISIGSGNIIANKEDIQNLNTHWWQQQTEYISQDPYIFHNTLRFNMCLGQYSPDDKDLWKILESLDLAKRIKSMPKGLDTIIGERGYGLSGGERQRLCLARAIINPRPLLILDEISSQLDVQTEDLILKTVGKLKQDRMILLISHRQAMNKVADKVIKLDRMSNSNINKINSEIRYSQ